MAEPGVGAGKKATGREKIVVKQVISKHYVKGVSRVLNLPLRWDGMDTGA